MVRFFLKMLVVFGLGHTAAGEAHGCPTKDLTLDFIVTKGSATLEKLEGEISKDLQAVGISVKPRFLEKDEFNAAMTSGDFNLCFSESWGPPYDPHSYAASWAVPDEAHFAALEGMKNPTKAELMEKISKVTLIEDEAAREAEWRDILTHLHEQAIDLPFSGKRNPLIMNRRLSGYRHGEQQFDYPLHRIEVVSGSKTITVAPGAQTGRFQTVGRLDPHSYRPNEFFANNLVYEGLLAYGQDGVIEPALAVSWTVADEGAGQKYVFQLRQGVKFHDGSAWDCSVAKLNFDHVLAKPLTTGDWHGWYDLMEQVNGWACNGDFEFHITTKGPYYPLLQELCYIRPLRMLSPAMFKDGAGTDPKTANSCPAGWGKVEGNGDTIECVGTLGVSGTGPWKYVGSTFEGEGDDQKTKEATFERFMDHWGTVRPNGAEKMILPRYDSAAAVMAALLDGSLDVVVGSEVIDPTDFHTIRTKHADQFQTSLSPILQNRVVILNSNKAPTDNLQVRKAIIHAVNKASILEESAHGTERPASTLFPKNAPYCDLDLTPRWDYDLEKAKLLLECPAAVTDAGAGAAELEQAKADLAAQQKKDAEELAKMNSTIADLEKELEKAKAEAGEVSRGARTAIGVSLPLLLSTAVLFRA